MRALINAIMALVTGVLVGALAGSGIMNGRLAVTKKVQVVSSLEVPKNFGLIQNTRWETARVVGTVKLLSEKVTERGNVRFVTFVEDPYRYEALVVCARPMIADGKANVYARINNKTNRVTFYVACGAEQNILERPS